MMKLCPVILAGGSGTRLWPLSREQYAKQLLTLTGNDSLLQLAAKRLDENQHPVEITDSLVICNEEHRFLVADQIETLGKHTSAIILEPEGRNTAPAATIAALFTTKKWEDSNILIMPADHLLQDNMAFVNAVYEGCMLASNGYVVTFGIVPTRAETGYGYIQVGEVLADNSDSSFKLNRFVEKPDQATAEKMLTTGGYLWNSGIFLLKASLWLSLINRFNPEIFNYVSDAFEKQTQDMDFLRIDRESFLKCPNDSIDYAVMEQLGDEGCDTSCAVISLDAGWSDIGSWSSVWELGSTDKAGNRTVGDVLLEDTNNSLVISESRLTAVLGHDDAVVVETPDAVLVTNKASAQDVRKLVDKLKDAGREEHIQHQRVYRPWGSYETVDSGVRFQVKRITVNPGKKLSLQLHHQRAEHWVVVRGMAKITRGEEDFVLKENESTFIPLGVKHRLENVGEQPLEVIEVQSGDYLGEDDIVRFEDDFGRH